MSQTKPNLLRLPAVAARVGFQKAKIYSLIQAGDFPPPVPLSARAVAWIESEVDEWVNAKIAARKRTWTCPDPPQREGRRANGTTLAPGAEA